MNRVLSVTQARSLYLKSLAESKRSGSSAERDAAKHQLNQSVRALQQAQMRQRLRGARGVVYRPTDWNEELS